jgi:hypothetical protein
MHKSTVLITHISWGLMEVTIDGRTEQFKDCKVWPGGAKEWDWNLTGTRHHPGTQPADIAEILEQGIEVLILSRGMDLVLQTHPDTEKLLQGKGIEYYIEETKTAVAHFNQLSQAGKRVGGIFHSTC